MESDDGKNSATTAKATYSPDDVEIVGQDDVENNEFVSEKSGTRKDQLDMIRMGKSQELKVCLKASRKISEPKTNNSDSVTLDSGPC